MILLWKYFFYEWWAGAGLGRRKVVQVRKRRNNGRTTNYRKISSYLHYALYEYLAAIPIQYGSCYQP